MDLQHHSFSCFFFDYDNDGWPDIYVNGYGGLKDVGDVAADYLGLPTTGRKANSYHNNHDGTFYRCQRQSHLDQVNPRRHGHQLSAILDNDGWLDFYVGTGNSGPRYAHPQTDVSQP